MTPTGIRADTIAYWLDELEKRCSPAVIRRGYDYAVRGKVASVHAENRVVRAYVQGSGGRMYAVKLDAGFFGISTCSCPFDGCCKHMCAVVFQACSLAGLNMESVAGELLQPVTAQAAFRETAAGREKTLKRPHYQHEAARQASRQLTEQASAEEWKRWLNERLDRSRIGAALPQLRQNLTEAAEQAVSGWSEQMAALFKLYVEMALMNAADQLARKFDVLYNVSYNGPSVETMVQIGMRQIGMLAAHMDAASLRSRCPDHVRLIREELGNHPFEMSVSNIDWLYLYRLLWQHVLDEPAWVRDEEKRLQAMLKDDRIIARKRELLHCARAHFLLLRGEDDKAWFVIEKLQVYGSPDLWLFYPELMEREQAWERLIRWLRRMFPLIEASSGRDSLQRYLRLWRQAASARTDCEPEWRDVLQRLLPASFAQYEDYLISRRAFRDWADLMMSLGIPAENIGWDRLNQVEAAEPQVLLPILHQAVAYHIARKNRDDYRLAVKFLKQLERTYGRLKREETWRQYLGRLRDRCGRLRSLREEMLKGGLRL
jgi:hypothetical protein